MDKYNKGDLIQVRAWWDKPNIVSCEVREEYHSNPRYHESLHDFLTVQPLSGNPHIRFIKISRDVSND